MLVLGADDATKTEIVERYIRDHGITKVFVLSPERFAPSFAPTSVTECDMQGEKPVRRHRPDLLTGQRGYYIPWPEHIEYIYYYKVIQQADEHTLLVLNEVLRGQNRNMLNFNCARTFMRYLKHQIVFQYLPLIDSFDDTMTLVDFVTGSKWWQKKTPEPEMFGEFPLRIEPVDVEIVPVPVATSDKVRAAYDREKAKLIAEVRGDPSKDPHVLPRNLLLVSGKAKLAHVTSHGAPGARYVGRNDRFSISTMETYRTATGDGERVVFELPHNFLEMTDYLAVSRRRRVEVLVADTKADAWYLDRYQAWAARLREANDVLSAIARAQEGRAR